MPHFPRRSSVTQPTRSYPVLRRLASGFALALLLPAATLAQDELEIASVLLAGPGETLQIPIYGRDLSGTALGGDRGSGRTSQSLALSLDITPAEAVTAVTIQRAGVTAQTTPIFSTTLSQGTVHSAILAFDEETDPLGFTLDAPSPGDLVALLGLTLDPAFDHGIVELAFVESTTGLGATGGTLLETVANNQLVVRGATVTVDSDGLFADGFESGDLSLWSGSNP